MDSTPFPSETPEPELEPPWQKLVRSLRGLRPPKPGRKTVVFVLLALLVFIAVRGSRHSFRSVPPGSAGISVSRLTGGFRVLPPGTYFRPPALFDLHAVRVSDQLLSGPAATFTIATKEGVPVQVTLQARWAIARELLISKWASLPPDPSRELVVPILASAFRAVAPSYSVDKVISDKREEITAASSRRAQPQLLEAGIVLKEVIIGDLTLPPEYEKGRVELVDEVQNTERMDVTLRLKAKEVERTRLEAEAQKAKEEKEAESAALQKVIAARGESDAMKFVLALKEKEIQQKKLEAQADTESRMKHAEADSAISKIQAQAEAERRKTLADAEAYAIRTTSLAQFENLKREAELVQANPLLIPKTFADRLSDKVQVILTPTIGGEAFTGEVLKRVANGKEPLAAQASR